MPDATGRNSAASAHRRTVRRLSPSAEQVNSLWHATTPQTAQHARFVVAATGNTGASRSVSMPAGNCAPPTVSALLEHVCVAIAPRPAGWATWLCRDASASTGAGSDAKPPRSVPVRQLLLLCHRRLSLADLAPEFVPTPAKCDGRARCLCPRPASLTSSREQRRTVPRRCPSAPAWRA